MTITLADPVPAAPTKTETRELAYYRNLATDLGKDLQRAQRSLEVANNALRRFQELHRLGRRLSLVTLAATTTDELCLRFFELVAQLNICSRALIAREQTSAPGAFAIDAAMGFERASLPDHFKLPMVPEFGFTTAADTHPPSAAASFIMLQRLVGLPSILWAYDVETGLALVLAITPGPANTDFQLDDRDLATVLLGTLLDVYRRLQARPTGAANAPEQEAAASPSRAVEPPSSAIFRINHAKPFITETDVTRTAQADEHVQHAFYVEWDDTHYFLFLTYDAASGYSLLRKWRGHSPRTFRDLRSMIRHVRDSLSYHGELTIYPRDDARVTALVEHARPLMAAAANAEDAEAEPMAVLQSDYQRNGPSERPQEWPPVERLSSTA